MMRLPSSVEFLSIQGQFFMFPKTAARSKPTVIPTLAKSRFQEPYSSLRMNT